MVQRHSMAVQTLQTSRFLMAPLVSGTGQVGGDHGVRSRTYWYRGLLSDAGFEQMAVVAERRCTGWLAMRRCLTFAKRPQFNPTSCTLGLRSPDCPGARIHREASRPADAVGAPPCRGKPGHLQPRSAFQPTAQLPVDLQAGGRADCGGKAAWCSVDGVERSGSLTFAHSCSSADRPLTPAAPQTPQTAPPAAPPARRSAPRWLRARRAAFLPVGHARIGQVSARATKSSATEQARARWCGIHPYATPLASRWRSDAKTLAPLPGCR